ncbi:glycosyltransferase family 4 protein [Pseudomonas sp. H2_H09]
MGQLAYFIIEPVGGHGGMNYYNTGLGQGLVWNDACVNLYTCPESQEQSSNNFTINKFFKGVYGQSNKFLRFARFIVALLRSIVDIKKKGGKTCHLHFFQYALLELITCRLLRLSRIKIIATIHDVESFAGASLTRTHAAILRAPREFIVHNEFSRRELQGVLAAQGLKTNITVIPHGNYLPFVKRREGVISRRRLALPEDKKIILFFGQIKKVKGLDVLLNAMRIVAKREPQAVLLIAGKVWKDSFQGYESLIKSNNISDVVIPHIRYIKDEDVDFYYSAADIVVLPYKKIYQSGVLLMAMSYGCITVSSRLPPMVEVVDENENGFLFETDNPHDLAQQIINALGSSTARHISQRARTTMVEKHDWSLVARQHIKVFENYE